MSDNSQSTDEIRASFAGHYDIERELLGGGMSRVFLANERALGRQVVIKVLPPDLAAGVNRERFRREVQLAAQLQHPHVVPLYAAGTQGDLLFYTMPFIEGESLKEALQAKVRFTPREVVRILHDVVDALGYAHSRGVIHRDIKPGNVLRSGSHAVVTDFGVAKAISAAMPAAGMTTSGMAIGTPAYMAPEQLAGDPAADHRVDLYAVGLLAYELLTGDTPFAAASPQEALAAQLTRAPAPLDKVRRDVPPAFSSIIMRCLAKRPDDRYQSAAELLAALDALQLPSGEFAAASRDRRPWLVLGAAAVVLAALAVLQRPVAQPGVEPAGRDTVTVSLAGPLLTRAESLAIAKAVEARMNEQRAALGERAAGASTTGGSGAAAAASGADSREVLRRMADSIRDEIQRAVFDSLARVQQNARGRGGRGPAGEPGFDARPPGARVGGLAPELDSLLKVMEQTGRAMRSGPLDPAQLSRRAMNLGPPRRVVVTEPRITSRSLEPAASIGSMLADTIRKTIGALPRFTIVDPDSVRAVLLKTRTIDDVAELLNAEVFASLAVFRAGADSVIWQLTVRDLTAHGAYATRAWTTPPAPILAPVPRLDTLLARTKAQLAEMDRAPRRPPPDTAPGGPLSREMFDARAASLGGPRRLIVWTHPRDPQHPDVEAAGTAVMDQLRKSLAANPRYQVVPTEETIAVLSKTRTPADVSTAARAELMLTIRGTVQRDSILWTVRVRDLGAFGPYQDRGVTAGRVPLSAPSANVDSLTRAVSGMLQVVDRAPRRNVRP